MNYTSNNTLNYQINSNTDLKVKDWRIDFLCDYIETNHHDYIRKLMPKILSVGKALAKKDMTYDDTYRDLLQFCTDLETHMHKEEKLLFPYIKKLNSISDKKEKYEIPPFGSIADLIKVIEKEHGIVNSTLIKIKNECGDFKTEPTEEANKKIFYELMNEFDSDFRIHVHFENDILFPRSISLEKKLRKTFFKNK